MNVSRFVVISGCSGGGKSALMIELGQRRYATVEKPGRRIVKEEMLGGRVSTAVGEQDRFRTTRRRNCPCQPLLSSVAIARSARRYR